MMRIRLADADRSAPPNCESFASSTSELDMILRRCLFASSVLMACALIWTGTGCRDEQAPQPPATPAAAAHASPEESFEEIVRLIKGGIETKAIGTATGFNIQSEKASSRFQINNVVTSKLIKPTDSTTPYRGTITVTSTSTYSLRHSADDADDKKQDVSPKDNGYNLDQASDADSGFDTMDDQLISAAPADEKADPRIHRKRSTAHRHRRSHLRIGLPKRPMGADDQARPENRKVDRQRLQASPEPAALSWDLFLG